MKIFYNHLEHFFSTFKPLSSFHYNIPSKVDGSNALNYPAMILESPIQVSNKPGCLEVSANIEFQDLLRNSTRSFTEPDVEVQFNLQFMADTLVQYLENNDVSVLSSSLMFYTDHSDNVVESCRLSMVVQIPKVIPCIDPSDSTLWYQGGTDIRPVNKSIIPKSW